MGGDGKEGRRDTWADTLGWGGGGVEGMGMDECEEGKVDLDFGRMCKTFISHCELNLSPALKRLATSPEV